MNERLYKMEIRRYGKTVSNMTPFSVLWYDVVKDNKAAQKMRKSIQPCLQDDCQFEVTVILT